MDSPEFSGIFGLQDFFGQMLGLRFFSFLINFEFFNFFCGGGGFFEFLGCSGSGIFFGRILGSRIFFGSILRYFQVVFSPNFLEFLGFRIFVWTNSWLKNFYFCFFDKF